MSAQKLEPILTALLEGEVGLVRIERGGGTFQGNTLPNIALLSGAFNPLHLGHRRFAEVGAQRLGRPVLFELPLVNADKAPLSVQEAARRAAQFRGWATLLLTRAPLFSQKAALFPGSVFLIGADTAARLVAPRFYGDDPRRMQAALEGLQEAGCRFLVAGRHTGAGFLTLADIDVKAHYELFETLSEGEFRLDVSSSLLRREAGEP